MRGGASRGSKLEGRQHCKLSRAQRPYESEPEFPGPQQQAAPASLASLASAEAVLPGVLAGA